MAVEINLTRSLRGLEGADDEAREALKAWPVGQVLRADVVIPRDNARLRYFWGLVKVILDNTDTFEDKDACAESIKLAIGHVKKVAVFRGGEWEITLTPKSIKLHKMEEPEFRDFIKRAETYACTILCVSNEQLADALVDYIAPGLRREGKPRRQTVGAE